MSTTTAIDEDTCSTASSTAEFEGPIDQSDDPEPSQPLEPFAHQVGGHFPMVCLDDQTVCKPINERERVIYQTIPEKLKPFVPVFHGVMKVEVRDREDGYITLTGHPPPQYLAPTPDGSGASPKSRLSLLLHRDSLDSPQISGNTTLEIESESPVAFCNPWALKCHRDHLAKLGLLDNAPKSSRHTYLLLENVVRNYQRPCVLDLKIGKRQYSDDCSESKIQRKIARSNQTTTASLGLRLAGMQVFRNGEYQCLNKYDGRSFDDASFIETLATFLCNSRLKRSLCEKVSVLTSVLQELNSYRFYTCSLLVSYDAAKADTVDIRIIDFAHATHQDLDDKIKYNGPDVGFIEGLSSLLNVTQSLC